MNEQVDTQPEAEAVLLKLLQQTPIWRKLQLMDQLNQMAHSLAISELRQQYPDADDVAQRRFLSERLFGREIARQLSGLNQRRTDAF